MDNKLTHPHIHRYTSIACAIEVYIYKTVRYVICVFAAVKPQRGFRDHKVVPSENVKLQLC